jgi:ATP-dependent helicase/nuclease subunit A
MTFDVTLEEQNTNFDVDFGETTIVGDKITIDDEMSDLEEKTSQPEKELVTVSLENSVQKKIPDFLSGKTEADGAEIGTAMHMFMQFADYESCETADGCKSEAKRLAEQGFITDKQYGLLNYDKLYQFFTSDLYANVKSSGKVYREQRFNLEVESFGKENTLYGDKDILVQGVIDLFFENGDGTYTVVDFKTDRVFGNGAENELIRRHRTQLMYYCKAVEEMTECKVTRAILYSFALSESVNVDFKQL